MEKKKDLFEVMWNEHMSRNETEAGKKTEFMWTDKEYRSQTIFFDAIYGAHVTLQRDAVSFSAYKETWSGIYF